MTTLSKMTSRSSLLATPGQPGVADKAFGEAGGGTVDKPLGYLKTYLLIYRPPSTIGSPVLRRTFQIAGWLTCFAPA